MKDIVELFYNLGYNNILIIVHENSPFLKGFVVFFSFKRGVF